MFDFMKSEEKKVEYVELIYDLIFVYIIGRNNSLVGHIVDGFIDPSAYLTYVLCTIITIQIWYMTTIFINRYGSNEFSEYVGLFINMFLLYYMADGTRIHWQAYFYRYNVAWMLILLNICMQYYLKYRKSRNTAPWEAENIKYFMTMCLVMIAVVLAGLPVFRLTGLPLTPLAMAAGIIMSVAGRKRLDLVAVDFPHLTERVMLYVVFSFGEMIITVAGYFGGDITPKSIYMSACAFLIVVGLFMSYGFLYDHLLDREMTVSGNAFMIIHIFIIFALSNLTIAIEFMPEGEIDIVPKTAYLIASFTIYYAFIFALAPFTKGYCGDLRGFKWFAVIIVLFVVITAALYKRPDIGIIFSVLLTFSVWGVEYKYWKDNIFPNE